MLYTLSQSHYATETLNLYLSAIQTQDAVVLWQGGCLLPLHHSLFIEQCPAPIYVLECDVSARNLTAIPTIQQALAEKKLCQISLVELVTLTEQYYPQLAL